MRYGGAKCEIWKITQVRQLWDNVSWTFMTPVPADSRKSFSSTTSLSVHMPIRWLIVIAALPRSLSKEPQRLIGANGSSNDPYFVFNVRTAQNKLLFVLLSFSPPCLSSISQQSSVSVCRQRCYHHRADKTGWVREAEIDRKSTKQWRRGKKTLSEKEMGKLIFFWAGWGGGGVS